MPPGRSSRRARTPAARRRAGGWPGWPRSRSRPAVPPAPASPRAPRGRARPSARRAARAAGRPPGPAPAWSAGAYRWRSRRRDGSGPRPARRGPACRRPAAEPLAPAGPPARRTSTPRPTPTGRGAGSRARACSRPGCARPRDRRPRADRRPPTTRPWAAGGPASGGTGWSSRPRWPRPAPPTPQARRPSARSAPATRPGSSWSGPQHGAWGAEGTAGASGAVSHGPPPISPRSAAQPPATMTPMGSRAPIVAVVQHQDDCPLGWFEGWMREAGGGGAHPPPLRRRAAAHHRRRRRAGGAGRLDVGQRRRSGGLAGGHQGPVAGGGVRRVTHARHLPGPSAAGGGVRRTGGAEPGGQADGVVSGRPHLRRQERTCSIP